MKPLMPLCLLGMLAACSSQADTTIPAPDAIATETATIAPAASARPTATATPNGEVLALEGLGDLAIGKPVPASSTFASRGAQIPGSDCKTLSSPDYPGVYALVEGGEVRRITITRDSQVRLIEGVGVGSTEAEVLAAFPGFKSEPHKYVGPKGRYLTQPGTDPRLRFETGEDGKVTSVHMGEEPQLTYVEGCA